MKRKVLFLFLFVMIILSTINHPFLQENVVKEISYLIKSSSQNNDVHITLDGENLKFDVKPRIVNDSTMVPLRAIFEKMGLDLTWDDKTKMVIGIKDDTKIILQIDNKSATVNDENKDLPVAPILINDRTLVPLRFIAESTGSFVDWDDKTRTAIIISKNAAYEDKLEKEFVAQGISIGDSLNEVIAKLGNPVRKDASNYGFEWYIYNEDYNKYIQVGIKDSEVVGIYTNSEEWSSKKGIGFGTIKEDVNKLYGDPITSIKKGNTIYSLNYSEDEIDTYLIEDTYATIFYDIHKNKTVTAIQLIDKQIEHSIGYYGGASEELRKSFENQVYDLANAIRVREGKKELVWDDMASIAARKHSKDMADNSYFSHTNLSGKSPFDRMELEGIRFLAASENIAAGQSSAIFAHEGWMNSIGHRRNILGDTKRLGVGVHFGGSYKTYYTQNFYSPR